MNKFDIFKSQIDMPNDVLDHVFFEHTDLYVKTKSWNVHIRIDAYIDIHQLITLKQYIQTYFKPTFIEHVDVTFKHEYILTFEMIKPIHQKLLFEYTQDKPSAVAIKNFEITYDHNSITCLIDEDSLFIAQHFKGIEALWLSYGYKITFQTQIVEAIPKTSYVMENEKKEREIVDSKRRQSVLKDMKDTEMTFKVKRSPERMRIKDIPMDQYRFDQYKNTQGQTFCLIEGEVVSIDIRMLRKSKLLTLVVADEDDAITVKNFINSDKEETFAKQIKKGLFVQVSGEFDYDTYQRDIVVMSKKIQLLDVKKEMRHDDAKVKRIEFHTHTHMSTLDGMNSVNEYVKQARDFGHEAIAITDHDGVYGFPDLAIAAKTHGIKPIYGAELSFVDQNTFYVLKDVSAEVDLRSQSYVVFDIETTGLSAKYDHIIEIAAVKILQGSIIDRFQSFINPHITISNFTTQLTSITQEMVDQGFELKPTIKSFLEFSKGSVLVAHNASFDVGFIEETSEKLSLEKTYAGYIDTLSIARIMYEDDLKSYNLKALAKHFKIQQEAHHRAEDDARVTGDIFLAMLNDLSMKGYKKAKDLYELQTREDTYKFIMPQHLNILVNEQKGLKNLYKIISSGLTTHYHKGPRTLKSVIEKYREGILVGSGCYKGDVFETALNKGDKALEEVMSFYDYIEVQPVDGYLHLTQAIGNDGEKRIQQVIETIVKTAKKLNKIIIASSDAHYLNIEDKMYRDIYITTPLVGGGIHDLKRSEIKPNQYFRTTDEMLHSFSFLGQDAYYIVVEQTHLLNKHIDHIQLFPSGLLAIRDDAFKDQLGIPSIEVVVKALVDTQMHATYGEKPHPIISARATRELKNIIDNKFAPIYYMSHLLVKNSLDEGYLVGSRGSVGSSLVATLMNITEVNPLKPHYYCKKGHFTAFEITEDLYESIGYQQYEEEFQSFFKEVYTGFDLEDQLCPVCHDLLKKDGHDIPFETFLGFKGDKIPDIDLNFSGEYQSKAHQYVKTLVGDSQAFRAGTLQTVAERNAFGYVKGYLEDHHLEKRPAQMTRMASRIEGVKRSTGQHPGGIIVVPEGYDIYDITPIQYPANNTDSEWYTTHYDYHAFETNLLKLDILGHDDPTMIKYLMDYVSLHPNEFPFKEAKDIPLDDKDVLKLFSQTDIIGISEQELMSDIATFAVPEFNTAFTRQMLTDIKPKTFAGLVKVSGLSHGTDVWIRNAQDLIRGVTPHGKVPIDNIIGCRDDIMVQLIDFGLDALKAFDIMEFVRKGKPTKSPDEWFKYESEMRLKGIPEWYIWSCQKIQYMFPKAHATAYVMMALRIAWFKIHKPLLFYSAYFSKRVDKFDYERMLAGPVAIKNGIKTLLETPKLTAKDEGVLSSLQVAYEMVLRGYTFKKIDINLSDAQNFIMENDGLRMPFKVLDGLGDSAALDVTLKRSEEPFKSREDVKLRTKLNQTVFAKLEAYGAFDDLIVKNDGKVSGLFAL
jgi:DNA polymerase-3 subunit alpha (Gram-positive type)